MECPGIIARVHPPVQVHPTETLPTGWEYFPEHDEPSIGSESPDRPYYFNSTIGIRSWKKPGDLSVGRIVQIVHPLPTLNGLKGKITYIEDNHVRVALIDDYRFRSSIRIRENSVSIQLEFVQSLPDDFLQTHINKVSSTLHNEWGLNRSILPVYWEKRLSNSTITCPGFLEMKALTTGMITDGPYGGRDAASKNNNDCYSGLGERIKTARLIPHAAWRLQNMSRYRLYDAQANRLRTSSITVKKFGISLPQIDLRSQCTAMAERASLRPELNEVYLFHGTAPENVLEIVDGGFDEKFCGGAFGCGVYLAEDVAKTDQYSTVDNAIGAGGPILAELHDKLFTQLGVEHPGDLRYAFACRTMLGHYARTDDGKYHMDGSNAARRSIFSSIGTDGGKQLSRINDIDPGCRELHHSLVVEKFDSAGGTKVVPSRAVTRFREFVVFQGDRVYPEYLIAYKREGDYCFHE